MFTDIVPPFTKISVIWKVGTSSMFNTFPNTLYFRNAMSLSFSPVPLQVSWDTVQRPSFPVCAMT